MDTNGAFQFNGIRHDRDYDVLVSLGIVPEALFFKFYKKITVKNEPMVPMVKNIANNYKMTKTPKKLWGIDTFCHKAKPFLEATY